MINLQSVMKSFVYKTIHVEHPLFSIRELTFVLSRKSGSYCYQEGCQFYLFIRFTGLFVCLFV